MNRLIAARRDPQTGRAYWTMGRRDAERAFRSVRRHSRLVRVLRIAVPLAAVLGLSGIGLVTYFNPLRMLAKLPVDVGNLVVSGTKITMEKPHLAGFTRDARAYELTGTTATQDLTKPDIVELHNLRAKLQMQDKSTTEVTALNGIYNSKSEILKLDQDILLTSSTGYQAKLSEALVDIQKNNVVSQHPVAVKMLHGTLNANRLDVVDSGELVRFDGGVDMVLMLNQVGAPPSKTGKP
jgi:lipopolysaccharide export system protein LptC